MMVKNNLKQLVISLIVFIFLVNIVHAGGERLGISNIDVKVGSKTLRGLQNGDTVPESARPGQTVEFRAEVRNNFTNQEDIRIQDITVKTTIEGIDGGNDLKIESDRFDLRADTERKLIFTFNIPLEVQEDTFNVVINAEGQDENGTLDSVEARLKLEVVKDNHNLMIVKKSITPTEVSCTRGNIQLATTILNIGNFDEDAISVSIKNSDLGININDQIGGLKARPNEPESRFAKIYPLKIPNDAQAGNYPINIKLLYNDDRQVTQDTATLTVSDCNKPQPVANYNQGASAQENSGVEVITPSQGNTAPSGQQPSVQQGVVLTQESFLTGNTFIVGVLIVEIAAVVIGTIAVSTLFKKRR